MIHIYHTDEKKTVTVIARIKGDLAKETVTSRTLLGNMMISATQTYPTSKLLIRRLESLYGGHLSCYTESKGKAHIISFVISFIDDRLLDIDESLFESQLKILNEILYHPYIINESFDETILKIRKKELRERLLSSYDDSYAYAGDRLYETMGLEYVLGVFSSGYIEDIDMINGNDLYEMYKSIIKEDNLEIDIIGYMNEERRTLINQYLPVNESIHTDSTAYVFDHPKRSLIEFIERKDVTQGIVFMGYRLNTCMSHNDHEAMCIMNALIGGDSQSLLFKKIREKEGLCYSIGSTYDSFNGIMTIDVGIDIENYELTVELIKKEIERLQEGIIDIDHFYRVKSVYIASIEQEMDDPYYLSRFNYNRYLAYKDQSIEAYIKRLRQVSIEDVIRCANEMSMDTIYFLTGESLL